jgi:hypothetical protein
LHKGKSQRRKIKSVIEVRLGIHNGITHLPLIPGKQLYGRFRDFLSGAWFYFCKVTPEPVFVAPGIGTQITHEMQRSGPMAGFLEKFPVCRFFRGFAGLHMAAGKLDAVMPHRRPELAHK